MPHNLEPTAIRSSLLAKVLIGGVRLYQKLLSPLMVSRCRFSPSCSTYAIDAISRLGAWKGTWLALCRVGRCHPWSEGGWDPVTSDPPSADRRTKSA